ncbi:MAG: response regulator [Betaproteobacteria bacterium]
MNKATAADVTADATVYVVDDDESIRELLAWLIKREGLQVQSFADAQSFLECYQPELPGCLVLDLNLPGMSGLDLQAYLNEKGVVMPVLFLSGRADVPKAVRAVKGGAIDFIEKPFDYKQIIELVRECLARDAAVRAVHARGKSENERLLLLSQREREVLELVVAGKLNREIADELGISIKTVEVHRAHVMEKMEVRSVAQLVQMTLRGGGSPGNAGADAGAGDAAAQQ